MIQIQGWWFPHPDVKCEKHFTERGFQIEHLDHALSFVTKWSVAIDGGAHVGSWSKVLASRFREVHSFELAFDTFECLQKNMANIPNVHLYHAALGDKEGRVGIRRTEHSLGHCVDEGTDIPMRTIDSLNLKKCDFIKLDLEGYEYHGLKGAEKTLRKYRPIVLIEEKGHTQKFGLDAHAGSEFLESLGYVLKWRQKPDKLFVPQKQVWWSRFFSK